MNVTDVLEESKAAFDGSRGRNQLGVERTCFLSHWSLHRGHRLQAGDQRLHLCFPGSPVSQPVCVASAPWNLGQKIFSPLFSESYTQVKVIWLSEGILNEPTVTVSS